MVGLVEFIRFGLKLNLLTKRKKVLSRGKT